jgi:hypothetical protein
MTTNERALAVIAGVHRCGSDGVNRHLMEGNALESNDGNSGSTSNISK